VFPAKSALVLSSIFLSAAFTACSRSANDKVVEELQSIASWTATVRMVAESWSSGAIPTPYTKQTLQKAQQEFQKETKTLRESVPAQPRLLEQTKQLEQISDQLQNAVEQNDRSTVTAKIQQLATEQQQIDRLAKASGEQP
jgi:hypothetical protein